MQIFHSQNNPIQILIQKLRSDSRSILSKATWATWMSLSSTTEITVQLQSSRFRKRLLSMLKTDLFKTRSLFRSARFSNWKWNACRVPMKCFGTQQDSSVLLSREQDQIGHMAQHPPIFSQTWNPTHIITWLCLDTCSSAQRVCTISRPAGAPVDSSAWHSIQGAPGFSSSVYAPTVICILEKEQNYKYLQNKNNSVVINSSECNN